MLACILGAGIPMVHGAAMSARENVKERLLGKTPEAGPDTNADGTLDAADLIASRQLDAQSLEFSLTTTTSTVTEGDQVEIGVWIRSDEEALGSYEVVIAYPMDDLVVSNVLNGTNPQIGQPSVVTNQPEFGRLTLAASQEASLMEPTGQVHVATIQFEATTPGSFRVYFLGGSGTDVAQFPRRVAGLTGLDIEILPIVPPD